MAALRDKGIALLGSQSVLVTAGSPTPVTIFTTPLGKVTRIYAICVYNPTASMAGGSNFSFGTGFRNNAAVTLVSLTTANTDYIMLYNHLVTGDDQKSTEIAAGTAFQVAITTGTTAVCTVTFDVFGYCTAT
jgi:hypothetical protein